MFFSNHFLLTGGPRTIMSKQQGFTLTELLIALVLLGVIASFAIPKVLKATADQKTAAVVKETAAMLEDAYYGNRLNGDTYATNLYTYIIDDLNYTARNTGALATLTGYPAAAATNCRGVGAAGTTGWVQLPSGAFISGLAGPTAANWHLICIDVDGVNGRNTLGVDEFLGNFINTAQGKAFYWSNAAAASPAGDLGFCDEDDANSGTANAPACAGPNAETADATFDANSKMVG